MSNIIGVIAIIANAVAIGVSAWTEWKQHQQEDHYKQGKEAELRLLARLEEEKRQREQAELRLLAQLEQERQQREQLEGHLLAQLKQEKLHYDDIECRFLAQLKQETQQREQLEHRFLSQLEQEQRQREQAEHQLLAQLEQERQQREALELRLLAQLEQERQQREEIEPRLLAQLEEEKRQREQAEHQLRVQLEQERQQREEIERCFPAQLEEERAEDYYRQGLEKGKRGNYREAIKDFTEALHLNSNSAKAYKYRGLAYSKLRENQAAIEDFQKAAELYRQQEVNEDYQDALDRIRNLKDSNQQNQETTEPVIQLPLGESITGELEGGIGEIETGIRDLETSLTNFFGGFVAPQKTPNFASTLSKLLASGRWMEADEETLRIMLKVTGREKEDWLNVASIQNFPSEDLSAIDKLWVKSSDGRFGFSVQKRIWESLGGNLKADDKIRNLFGEDLGWRVNKKWLRIDELTFNSSAPVGHLPAVAVRLGGLSWGVDGFWWEKREAYEFLLSQKDW